MFAVCSNVPDDSVLYILPQAIDRMHTFTGSALPFASEAMAFSPHQYPRTGKAKPDNTVEIRGLNPNWYYRNGQYRPPRVMLIYRSNGTFFRELVALHGLTHVPHRSLVSTTNTSKLNRYITDHEVKTQEQYLRDQAFNDEARRPLT